MRTETKPEVLPPPRPRDKRGFRGRLGATAFDDRNLDRLAHLLDDFIRIPGTPIRFGLDGIVGFIPGVGDVLGGLASTILIVAAWSRGIPRSVILRMVLNVAIETGVGALPVVGNLFDIGWRANRRNYALLAAATGRPEHTRRSSWLFLSAVALTLLLLVAAPILLAGWLFLLLKHAIAGRG